MIDTLRFITKVIFFVLLIPLALVASAFLKLFHKFKDNLQQESER